MSTTRGGGGVNAQFICPELIVNSIAGHAVERVDTAEKISTVKVAMKRCFFVINDFRCCKYKKNHKTIQFMC